MTRQLDLTVQGVVGTHPLLSRVGSRNRPYCRFRVAVTPTYRTDQGWHNGETMWFTAKAWGQLAENISRSMRKGDPVLLSGRLTEDTWDSGSGERTSNVIVLQSAGHDLTRGETRFMRIKPASATEDGRTEATGQAAAAQAVGPDHDAAGSAPAEAGAVSATGTAASAGSAGSPATPDAAPWAPESDWRADAQGAEPHRAETGGAEAGSATGSAEADSAEQAGAEVDPDPRGQGPGSPVALVTVPQPGYHRSADYVVVDELPEPAF